MPYPIMPTTERLHAHHPMMARVASRHPLSAPNLLEVFSIVTMYTYARDGTRQ